VPIQKRFLPNESTRVNSEVFLKPLLIPVARVRGSDYPGDLTRCYRERMDYERIYRFAADEYDRLVSAEDCDGNLLPAIESLSALAGRSVLEVGAGTARITRLIAARGARIVALDRSPAMLRVGLNHMTRLPTVEWQLVLGDAADLPVAAGWADLAIAGWTFGHFCGWFPGEWRYRIGQGLDEMTRALKPGGFLILVETLGTGSTDPHPPAPELAAYYRWLENENSMTRIAIRTDYLFSDVDSAAAVTGAFFGDAFAARVRREGWTRVPECTGLWWKRNSTTSTR
jgi:ubiquinone/menaquinone biosynthesis C-methylase UbiE